LLSEIKLGIKFSEIGALQYSKDEVVGKQKREEIILPSLGTQIGD
jgi:hypothetical protein